MPFNTVFYLKARFERKKAHKISETWFLFWCNVLPSARMDFCAARLFPGTLIDFRFSDVTEVLMKDLVRMLIHVRKI